MPTDPDGDSQMASSPESQSHLQSEDSPTGSRTPTTAPAANALAQFAAASELSPPGSQTKQMSGVSVMSGLDQSVPSTAEPAPTQQQPGSTWMNKRAEEEYQRAMEYVVDKDFSLQEFGDPFDERDMEEKLV